MDIEFFSQIEPPTATAQERQARVVWSRKHRKYVPQYYDPPHVEAAKRKLADMCRIHRPTEPLQGAVRLTVKWCFKCTAKHPDGDYRTTRPDTDNLQKALKDVMTGLGFWGDDAQVAEEFAGKYWSETPGLYVRAEELPPSAYLDGAFLEGEEVWE